MIIPHFLKSLNPFLMLFHQFFGSFSIVILDFFHEQSLFFLNNCSNVFLVAEARDQINAKEEAQHDIVADHWAVQKWIEIFLVFTVINHEFTLIIKSVALIVL